MSRERLALCLVACLVLAGCGGVEYPPTAEGRYLARCSRCHEPDGSSTTASEQAKKQIDLRAPLFQRNVTDAEIAEVVLYGKGRMAPISGIGAAEIDSVILHLRRLGASYASSLDSRASDD